MSNGLDPDQGRHSVGPDLVLNCLQMLSADNILKLLIAMEEFKVHTFKAAGQ